MSTADLMPTLVEAVGLDVPEGVQGRSLLPLVGGGTDPGRPESVFVQISEDLVGRAVRTERWKYVVSAPPGTDAWREPAADRYRETELYDLASDPYELENLVGLTSHREVADGPREAPAGWLLRVEEAEPVIEPAAPRSLDQRRPESFPHDRVPWEG